MNNKVVVILGATATGKSHLGIKLAQQLNGEIISGDSVLVYRQLDIGSAKPTPLELALVPHHMIDIIDPTDNFDVLTGKTMMENTIKEILDRGKTPIIVGGTGLYIKAFLEDYSFLPAQENSELRQELERFAAHHGNQALHDRLAELDSTSADKLHPNDTFRVIRAIEISLQGYQKQQASALKHIRKDFQITVYGLNIERSRLYNRINQRVDTMLECGLQQEVQSLLDTGVPPTAQSLKAIGYKQMVDFLQGNYDYNTCVDKIKQATRKFAKRQITFFKAMPYIKWIELDENPCWETITEQITAEVQQNEN